MKSPFFALPSMTGLAALSTAAVLGLAGCGKQPPVLTPEQQEQEVERRVAQKLAEEQAARRQEELASKERELTDREKELAAREAKSGEAAEEEPPRQANSSASRPAPPSGNVQGGQPGSYDVFYDSLDPYGSWFETGQYGLVWQPNVAATDPGWRPYTDGHWAYTDAGWAWVSDEPFGWAAYHYGRWTRLVGTGWVWVPGDQWAPAWVSWRNNDDYVGWAPLPPESRGVASGGSIGITVDQQYDIAPASYCFVPFGSFGEPELRYEIVEPARNVTIINRTVNVTNITIQKNVVINHGPSFTLVQKRSRRPFERLKIDRRHDFRSGDRGDRRPVAGKGTLQVVAPVIEKDRQPKDRPKVKKRLDQVAVDRSPQPPERTPGRRDSEKHPRDGAGTATPAPRQPTPAPTARVTPSPTPASGQRPAQTPARRDRPQPSPAGTASAAPTPWVTPTPWPTLTPRPAPTAPPQRTRPDRPAPTPAPSGSTATPGQPGRSERPGTARSGSTVDQDASGRPVTPAAQPTPPVRRTPAPSNTAPQAPAQPERQRTPRPPEPRKESSTPQPKREQPAQSQSQSKPQQRERSQPTEPPQQSRPERRERPQEPSSRSSQSESAAKSTPSAPPSGGNEKANRKER